MTPAVLYNQFNICTYDSYLNHMLVLLSVCVCCTGGQHCFFKVAVACMCHFRVHHGNLYYKTSAF